MSTETSPTVPTTPTATPRARPGSGHATWRRLRALTRANTTLLVRNRLTLTYAVVLPLLPLVALGFVDGERAAGLTVLGSTALLALMFPVFYNLLSLFVTRRDELVLKRLRTGEARDGELVLSLALPGCVLAVAVMVVAVVIGVAVGLPVPVNPLLYLVTVLAGCAIFAGLALVSAAFTRTSEAAQITSMPVILLAILGSLVDVLPGWLADVAAYTPVAAIDRLLEISWFATTPGAGGASDLSFASTFVEAGEPLLVLAVWTVVSLDLARRYLRWEPRT